MDEDGEDEDYEGDDDGGSQKQRVIIFTKVLNKLVF